MKQKIKSAVWAPLKAKWQENKILSELNYYRELSRKKGIDESKIHDSEYVGRLLQDRLSKKGIHITPKEKGDLNIVYLSCMDYWEEANMPQALEKFGKVNIFNTDENGYRIREQIYPLNWVDERKVLNRKIYNYVSLLHQERPVDIVISYLSGYHLLPSTVNQISELGIPVVAFWLDDKLKFRSTFDGEVYRGAASVCASYDLNLTSASSSVIKYFAEDSLAIFWPEGANPENFKPITGESRQFDVSFIGAKYGSRPKYINYLRRNGIDVQAFGFGWENGSVRSEDMPKIYAQSKINLGFGGIGYSMTATCLKGRDFEVPMSGTVYLTSFDEDLPKVYDLGKHIFTYRTKKEMLEKIQFLLANHDICEQVRKDARDHCLKNHTWEERFRKVFELFKII